MSKSTRDPASRALVRASHAGLRARSVTLSVRACVYVRGELPNRLLFFVTHRFIGRVNCVFRWPCIFLPPPPPRTHTLSLSLSTSRAHAKSTDLYSPPRLLRLPEVAHAKPDADRGGDDCSETGGERLRVEARGRRRRLRNVSEREELFLEGKGLDRNESAHRRI